MIVQCPNCHTSLKVNDSLVGTAVKCPKCNTELELPPSLPTVPPTPSGRFRQYKVITVTESGCSTILLGAASLPTDIMEQKLNQEVANGWQVVFMIVERRRYLLFWTREAVVITLGR